MKIKIRNKKGPKQELENNPKFKYKDVKPDIEKIKSLETESYENLVVIGNGGSITSFRALYYAFMQEIDKHVRIVTTMDPDYLNKVANECLPENTKVVAISKSGETIGVIESLLYFSERGYDITTVTLDKESTLKRITEKRGYEFIEHRDVGGRFSGLTETALVPAHLTGQIDIQKVRKGGEELYEKLGSDEDPAQEIAETLYRAEKQGYQEILNPIYSTRLYGFLPLNIQLMHETVCKEGEGQTIYGDIGPEYQHHTNQRLFGGKPNVIPVFQTLQKHNKNEQIHIEQDIQEIKMREKKLGDLSQNSYQESLEKEYEGVKQTLIEENKPYIEIKMEDISEENMGELIALMQGIAVYSASYRDVDPYSQPDVEKSKTKAFNQRFNN